MKIIYIIICLFAFLKNTSTAQRSLASGYMGKKFTIGVESSYNFQVGSTITNSPSLIFDLRPYLQYSIYDRFAIRATSIPFKKELLKNPEAGLELYYPKNLVTTKFYNTSSNHFFNPSIKGATVSFIYFNQGISPIGACYYFQLSYYNLSSTDYIKPTLPTEFQQNFKCIEPAKYIANVYLFAFGFERNYIVLDCINVNFGIGYGLNFPYIFKMKDPYEGLLFSMINIKYPTELNIYYQDLMYKMTRLSNGIRFHAGLAYVF